LIDVAQAVGFGRALRRAGLSVETRRVTAFREASGRLAPPDLYWAGRATLVSRHDEIAVFDRVFGAFFGGGRDERPPGLAVAARRRAVGLGSTAVGSDGRGSRAEVAAASATEVLRRKSFADCTPDELASLHRLLTQLRLVAPVRRTRRRRLAPAGEPDLRRTIRRSFRTGAEPVELVWRARRQRPRRIVFLLDVSGSMAAYSRALLVFAHAAVRADRRFEVFAFGTRLTRLTPALDTLRAGEALRRATDAVADWEGGTRIGPSLRAFLDGFGRPGLARGAVVVVCSDGLEVGDPALVGEQMRRMSRLAHRVVWINPLRASPEYEPLARGMAAALPYVDVFASGHSLESLEEVTRAIEAARTRRARP
jgi:uncharacterized protein with von Willebrand factor type A (vWA) domain